MPKSRVPPFGYRDDADGLRVPDPQACYVLEIMRILKLVGASYREIAEYLNSRGYRTACNLDWTLWSVRQIFRLNRFVAINNPAHLRKELDKERLLAAYQRCVRNPDKHSPAVIAGIKANFAKLALLESKHDSPVELWELQRKVKRQERREKWWRYRGHYYGS